jgi:GMP synthase-like glutamine amidotransferase
MSFTTSIGERPSSIGEIVRFRVYIFRVAGIMGNCVMITDSGDSKEKLVLLDCTGEGNSAEPWFRAALAKCGQTSLRTTIPESGVGALEGATCLLISGSPRDAFADDETTLATLAVVESALTREIPVLGICYGHQLLGRIAGARVGRNPGGWEVGECIVEATDEKSLLGLKGKSRVLQSHLDIVFEVPAGCRLLAQNEHSPVQAAEWGPGVFGVQFHPEFTGEILREVWTIRRDVWRGKTSFDLDAKLNTAGDCDDGLAVLRSFLHTVCP